MHYFFLDPRNNSRFPFVNGLLRRLLNIALLSAAAFGVSAAVALGVSLF